MIRKVLLMWLVLVLNACAGINLGIGATAPLTRFSVIDSEESSDTENDYYQMISHALPISIDLYASISFPNTQNAILKWIDEDLSFRVSYLQEYVTVDGFFLEYPYSTVSANDLRDAQINRYAEFSIIGKVKKFNNPGTPIKLYFDVALTYEHILPSVDNSKAEVKSLNGSYIVYDPIEDRIKVELCFLGIQLRGLNIRNYITTENQSYFTVRNETEEIASLYYKPNLVIKSALSYRW